MLVYLYTSWINFCVSQRRSNNMGNRIHARVTFTLMNTTIETHKLRMSADVVTQGLVSIIKSRFIRQPEEEIYNA